MLQLCLEFVSNHISPASPQFKDFVEHGEASRYKDMFVRWEDVWPGGEISPRAVGEVAPWRTWQPAFSASHSS
jgi:glycosidase